MDVKEELEDGSIAATHFEECFVSGVPEHYKTEGCDLETTENSLTCDSTFFSDQDVDNKDGKYLRYTPELPAGSNSKGYASHAQSISCHKSFLEQLKASRESGAVFGGDVLVDSDYNAENQEGMLAAQSNDDYKFADCTETNKSDSLFVAQSLTEACSKEYYINFRDNGANILSVTQATSNMLTVGCNEMLILPSKKSSKQTSKRKRKLIQRSKDIFDESVTLRTGDDELLIVGSDDQYSVLISPSPSTQKPVDGTRSKGRCGKSVEKRDLVQRVNQRSTEFDGRGTITMAAENVSSEAVETYVTILTDNHELWVAMDEEQIGVVNLLSSEMQLPSKRCKLNERSRKSDGMLNLSEQVNQSSMELNEGGVMMTSAKSRSSLAEFENISTPPLNAENTWIMCTASTGDGEFDYQESSVCDLPTTESNGNDTCNESREIESEMITFVEDDCFYIIEPLIVDGEEQAIKYISDSVGKDWPEEILEETMQKSIARVDMFDTQEVVEEPTALNNDRNSENDVILVNWNPVMELPSIPRKPLIMCRSEGDLVKKLLSRDKVESLDSNDCLQSKEVTKTRRRKQSIVYKSDTVDEPSVTIIDSDDDIEMILIASKDESETDSDDETENLFEDDGFTCNICRKSFDSLVLLGVHNRTHHSTKSYQCLECEVIFFSEFGLECHLCEQEDISFVCKQCERVFPSEWNVVSHECVCGEDVQTHSRAACKICGVNLTRRLLTRHLTECHADALAVWNVTDLDRECSDLQSAEELSD